MPINNYSQFAYLPEATQLGYTPEDQRQVTTPYMGKAPKLGFMPGLNKGLYGEASPSLARKLGRGAAIGAGVYQTTGSLPLATLAAIGIPVATGLGDVVSDTVNWFRR